MRRNAPQHRPLTPGSLEAAFNELLTDLQLRLPTAGRSLAIEYLTTDEAAALTRASRATVFDWHYRPHKYGVPPGMFHKRGRRLLVRRDLLMQWFLTRRK